MQWFTVIQLLILEFKEYTVYESVLIISKRQSTFIESPVIFDLCAELLANIGIPQRF
jgi:hypothetical protein